MRIGRVGVLLAKDMRHSLKSYFFVFGLAAPLIMTVFVQLVFGSLFAGKPKLGVFDCGDSRVVALLKSVEAIQYKSYGSEEKLKEAVASGSCDAGMVLPGDLDRTLKRGERAKLVAYIWGESLLKDRTVIELAVLNQIRELTGRKAPVEIISVSLGDEDNVPWKDRFLPVLVLMAIFISGFTVPASSLVAEKQNHTIGAVLTTPATLGEVFVSKGLMGIFLSMTMGISILILNQAFNATLGLILPILFLGAVMAVCFGLMLGAFVKDMAPLYTVIKLAGFVLYVPGIFHLFPKVPAWVGRIFPTFYVINPLMDLTRKGGGWQTIRPDVTILVGIVLVCIAAVAVIAKITRQQEA